MRKISVKILFVLLYVLIPNIVFAEANVIDSRISKVDVSSVIVENQMTDEEIKQQQKLYEQALAEYNLLLQQLEQAQQTQQLQQNVEQNSQTQYVVGPNVVFQPNIFDVNANVNNGDFNNEVAIRPKVKTPTGIINKDVKAIDYRMKDDTQRYNGIEEMPEELRTACNNTFNGTRANVIYDNPK